MAPTPLSTLLKHANKKPAPGPSPKPKPSAPTPVPTPTNKQPSPAPAPAPKPFQKPGRSLAPVQRKRPGVVRSIAGQVAGQALRDTGPLGRYVVNKIQGIREDGGAPVNVASSGAVAGLGKADGSAGDPGVKKGRKAPMLSFKLFTRARKLKNVT